MNRSCITALALLALLAPLTFADDIRFGEHEPKPKAAGVIRLATYNAENLFDDKDDPTLSGEQDDMSSVKPVEHIKALAEAIRRLDADVIGMEEIESKEVLTSFRDQYLQGLGYDYVESIGPGDERGIEQSVLSRFPIKEAKIWKDLDLGGVHPEKLGNRPNRYAGQPLKTRRSPLMVTVEVPAERAGGKPYDLTLFVVHHKSGRDNNYWREAEATKFSGMIKEIEAKEPTRNIAVLGDFNAQQSDKSVKIYEQAGFSCVSCAGEGSAEPTKITHESGKAIDMIWVNPALRAEIVPNSSFVLGTPLRPEGADWRIDPPPAGYASDHMPVAVDITPKDQ